MFENKVFLVTYGISPESGVTVATLNQSKMFTDANYNVSITTFDYQPKYKSIFDDLKSMNRVYENVHHLNKYEYYSQKNNNSGEIDKSIYKNEIEIKGKSFFKEEKENETILSYFEEGSLIKSHFYQKNELVALEYYNKVFDLVKRVEFNERQSVSRKIYYSEITKNIARESYFSDNGFCFLTRYYNEIGEPGQVFLFDIDSTEVKKFSGNKAHDKFWLNEIAIRFKHQNKKPLFISNGQGSGPKIMGIDKKHAKRAYFVHNNHFESPFTTGSKVKNKYDYVFKRIDKLDALIVLTEKQKKDIQEQYGKHNNIYVIPNAITISKHEQREKRDNNIIMVTRLEPQKNIQRAIAMFRLVVEKRPDAILNIFGKGKEEKKLQNKIDEYKLGNNVFLKGYSRDIKEEIKSSVLSLLTSNYEGLPLAAVESLENETPVVSYDFNYGATDIIDHNETGFIVELDDEKIMADKILYLLDKKEVASNMGKFGRLKMIDKYSNEVVYQKWMNMLKELG
ncbi:glycosyltransferase [Alkalicoccobacillus plakortidis]|uniref:Glycosyltransferase n=1 Tax=Alkalicoccobacillus plakortidis TaxID=444060 RepID=A0ABT0XIM3_9BACI|nr:glycosyltransferase [Alkalicoccobacillus plakortidis]MCM2675729.1 glycosyltransferase [Alkalicoccobacillus plakortidis]